MGWRPTGGGESPLTTKGDLHTYDTADARLAVGTNTHVLTVDSAQALGVKWAAPSGGGGDFTFIEEDDLAGDGIVSFSGIAASYRELMIVGRVRGANAVVAATLTMRVGNSTVDTGSNYTYGVRFARDVQSTGFLKSGGATFANISLMAGGSTAAGHYTSVRIWIYNYTDTSDGRNWLCDGAGYDDLNDVIACSGGGEWSNTADTVDIVTFASDSHTSDLEAGSRLALYGIG